MATSEQYFSLVRTSKSSWIAVPSHQTAKAADGTLYVREAEAAKLPDHIFERASGVRTAFTERYPRLTIAAIAFALFSISVTAEVELLRHAGYFWQ